MQFSISAFPGMHRKAGDLVNRLLDPGLRRSLGSAELAHLGQAIASSIHLVYIIAGLAAVVTLALACALPAALSPTRPHCGEGTRIAPRGEDNPTET